MCSWADNFYICMLMKIDFRTKGKLCLDTGFCYLGGATERALPWHGFTGKIEHRTILTQQTKQHVIGKHLNKMMHALPIY